MSQTCRRTSCHLTSGDRQKRSIPPRSVRIEFHLMVNLVNGAHRCHPSSFDEKRSRQGFDPLLVKFPRPMVKFERSLPWTSNLSHSQKEPAALPLKFTEKSHNQIYPMTLESAHLIARPSHRGANRCFLCVVLSRRECPWGIPRRTWCPPTWFMSPGRNLSAPFCRWSLSFGETWSWRDVRLHEWVWGAGHRQ